ncbi:MAG: poly-gamma-glutamate biosynthesis protein PgsC [Clostridia bacterium]|nr:poly-gamma-glutamate biosynthesis protein PgsC [Clostridia bacterium]
MTITLSIGIGLIVSFIFTELTGLYGGGLIVPGYLALYLDQPARIIATFAVALAAYGVVWVLSSFMILYGRRRFMAMVLVGFWLGLGLSRVGIYFSWARNLSGQGFRAVGYIIPGLIANDIARQGAVRTFASVLFLAAVVRLAMVFVK